MPLVPVLSHEGLYEWDVSPITTKRVVVGEGGEVGGCVAINICPHVLKGRIVLNFIFNNYLTSITAVFMCFMNIYVHVTKNIASIVSILIIRQSGIWLQKQGRCVCHNGHHDLN